MIRLFKRNNYSVSIIDKKWNKVFHNFNFKTLPRQGEFIFIGAQGKYYLVLNVIHNIEQLPYEKQGIFIIVEEVAIPNNENKTQTQ